MDRFVEGPEMLCARHDGYDRIEVHFRVFELWRTRFSWEQLQDNPDLVPLAALSAETGAGDVRRLNEIVDSADMASVHISWAMLVSAAGDASGVATRVTPTAVRKVPVWRSGGMEPLAPLHQI